MAKIIDGTTVSQPSVILFDPIGSGDYTVAIPKDSVVTPIVGTFIPNPPSGLFTYGVISRITIATVDNTPFVFDLQIITNQSGWTISQAGVTQAITDITTWLGTGGGGGGGTVTDFTAGNLSPLFTTSVATPTTTPALSFTAVNQNANLIYASPASGSAAVPSFRALVINDLFGGTGASSSTFLRGDGTWATPAGGGTIGGSIAQYQVAIGSGTDTITGGGGLTYNYSTGVFTAASNFTSITVQDGLITLAPNGGIDINGATYSFPGTIASSANSVLTDVLGNGTLSWVVSGGAPVYGATLIPFGDGSTAGGVTDNSFYYNLSSQEFNVGGGNPVIEAYWSSGDQSIFLAGDLSGNGNSTAILLNDSAASLTLQAAAGTINFTPNWLLNGVPYQWTGTQAITETGFSVPLYNDGSGNLSWNSYLESANISTGELVLGDKTGNYGTGTYLDILTGGSGSFAFINNAQPFITFNSEYSTAQSAITLFPISIPTYANDAAAGVGGLTSGQVYQTGLVGGISFLAIKQ